MERRSESELVRAAQSGDRTAFGVLVRRYQGLVYGLAYHRVASFADAQDIAQEAFIRAFRSLGQLERPESFAPWLKTIAANECKAWLRARRHEIALDEPAAQPGLNALASEGWHIRERQAEIRRVVDSLPEKSRLVVSLHYLSGLSHHQIGEFLGVTANAVAQSLHRARRQLKEMLLAEIEEDYAMNKLTESFAEEVLGRIALYPVTDGAFMVATGEGDVRGMTFAVADEGSRKRYITLWSRDADLNEIVLGTLPARTSENPKGRALDSALQALSAFDIEIKRVVLRLADARKCRAAVDLKQRSKELTVDMRPSDAMALAVRSHAPIYAEELIIPRGNVAEDDVAAPDSDMNPAEHSEEYHRLRQHDLIIDKVYQMGVSTEDHIDTVRFRQDVAAGVVRVWLEAAPDRELTLDLKQHSAGVEMIFDLARRRGSNGRLVNGDLSRGWEKRYNHAFSMLGEDARMRITLEPSGE